MMLESSMGSSKGKAAFSLQEMLIVFAIAAIAAVLAVPAYQGIRLRSDTLHDVRTVRNLQMANGMYATEHNGWYVPFAAQTDVPGQLGSAWYQNHEFRGYMGVGPHPVTGSWNPYPPDFLSNRLKAGRDAYGWGSTSYAYTDSVHGARISVKPIYQTKTTGVYHPSELLAFASSCDWWIAGECADDYRQELDGSHIRGATAYRYGGKAVVSYFDGHAAALRHDEVAGNDKLWNNKP